jgi:predicted DCC family thiol-disulfide oxidoreductase YuxK
VRYSRGVSELSQDVPLLLFDGECNLCHGAVQFVLRRDRTQRFRFAALRSAVGQQAIAAAGVTGALPDSMVLIHRGRLHVKSGAALRVAKLLPFPWPLAFVFWLVPSPLRDLVYAFVARHRYRWFGKRQACWVPTAALRARFLDRDERQ